MIAEPILKQRFSIVIEQLRASLPKVLVARRRCFLQNDAILPGARRESLDHDFLVDGLQVSTPSAIRGAAPLRCRGLPGDLAAVLDVLAQRGGQLCRDPWFLLDQVGRLARVVAQIVSSARPNGLSWISFQSPRSRASIVLPP